MNNYQNSLKQLLNRAAVWHITPGLVYGEPFSAEEFLALVDSINTIYTLMHEGTGNTDYVREVAFLNTKANIVKCVNMEQFWDIEE